MDFKLNKNALINALKYTPVAAQTYSKSYRYFSDTQIPLFIERGQGSKLIDVDHNELTDFVCGLGSITLGYNVKQVNNVIKDQLDKGIVFSTQSTLELKYAKLLSQHIPGCEMVRFLKNGSDATSAAVRLARAFTGKDIILMSGYHGMDDWCVGSTMNHNGVPNAVRELTKTFEYNNFDDITNKVKQYAHNLAAIILEPIQANGPKEGYLAHLRKIAFEHKIMLIFDEVVSGFRYAIGGASELYGIVPDLAAFGKGIANGMPLSVVCGKKDILELISKDVFISSTFGGEALSLASAITVLEYYKENQVIAHFWSIGSLMQEGLRKLIQKHELESSVKLYGLPPRNGIIFQDTDNYDSLELQTLFVSLMIEKGYLTLGVNNFMHNHSSQDVQGFLDAADSVFEMIGNGIKGEPIVDTQVSGKINPIFSRNTPLKDERN